MHHVSTTTQTHTICSTLLFIFFVCRRAEYVFIIIIMHVLDAKPICYLKRELQLNKLDGIFAIKIFFFYIYGDV